MPPRAYWKGQLKLSLIALPVRMYNATSSSHRIAFNQLHAECKNRIRMQTMCPEHGPVPRSDLVKGYEFEKGKYVVIDEGDLEHLKLESNRTLDLVQFIDATELDPLLLNAPYYVAPDGAVGEEAFCVIREAMIRSGKIGIGRVVLSNREHVFALRVEGRGFCMTTLRYADEIRNSEPYFEDIPDKDIAADHLELAQQLVDKHSTPFDPKAFKDRYHDALVELVKAKIEGSEPVVPQEAEAGKVVNLMEALKASIEAAAPKKPPAGSVKSGSRRKKARGA